MDRDELKDGGDGEACCCNVEWKGCGVLSVASRVA